jgi:hypothetical protein
MASSMNWPPKVVCTWGTLVKTVMAAAPSRVARVST